MGKFLLSFLIVTLIAVAINLVIGNDALGKNVERLLEKPSSKVVIADHPGHGKKGSVRRRRRSLNPAVEGISHQVRRRRGRRRRRRRTRIMVWCMAITD